MRPSKDSHVPLSSLPDSENDEEKKKEGVIKGPKIELRDVWFKYPTRDVPVLCGLNMTIDD